MPAYPPEWVLRSDASVCVSVCQSDCTRSKSKTAWAINTKLDIRILYSSRSACIDPEVKGQSHMVTKTATAARLLDHRRYTIHLCYLRLLSVWVCMLIWLPMFSSLFMFTAVNNTTKAKSGTNRYTLHSTLHKSTKHYIILDKTNGKHTEDNYVKCRKRQKSRLLKRHLNDWTLEKSSGCAFKLFHGNTVVSETTNYFHL